MQNYLKKKERTHKSAIFIQITFKTHEMLLFLLKNIPVLEVNSFISFKFTIRFPLESKL